MARKNRRKRIAKDTAIEQLLSTEARKTAPPSPWDVSKSLREQAKREKIVTERLNKMDTWSGWYRHRCRYTGAAGVG